MHAREEVVASIKAVRKSEPGLTEQTIKAERPLLDVLGTDDPREGVARLSASVHRLTEVQHKRQREDGQALQAALGIGVPLQKNVSARRKIAVKTGLFIGAERTQYVAEDRAIEKLVDLLLAQRDPFQAAGPVTVDGHDQEPAAVPDDLDDPPPPPADPEAVGFIAALREAFGSRRTVPLSVREHWAIAAIFGAGGTLLGLLLILWATDSVPSWLHDRHKPRSTATGRTPSAAQVTTSPQIDNTRGWGPERKTFTVQRPAPYPVFNSITDQPTHGDERNFVQCKDADEGNDRYADELVAKDGHTYDCMAFIDNDVSPGLDSIATPNAGGNLAAKIQGARLRVWFPENHTYNPGLTVILSSNNTNPSEVWDSCNFVAPRPVSLRYVIGSARLHTNGTPKNVGAPLPGAEDAPIHGKGALLGDTGDGLIGQNSGYVIFQMSVEVD